jgi:hypothetical protein
VPQNTVTVTGSDRTRLLADLTIRLGRVEVVEERAVQLADGSEGWELKVSHRPFVGSGAPVPEVAQAPPRPEPRRVVQPPVPGSHDRIADELQAATREREQALQELASAERERAGAEQERAAAAQDR